MAQVPGGSLAAAIPALRSGGRYLNGNPRLSILIRAPFVRRFTSKTATCAFGWETRDELAALRAMIEEGAIRAPRQVGAAVVRAVEQVEGMNVRMSKPFRIDGRRAYGSFTSANAPRQLQLWLKFEF